LPRLIRRNDKKLRVYPWTGYGWLVILSAAFAVLVISFVFGSVSGWEFSPQNFQRRQYQFWRIPGIRWQILPTHREAPVDPFGGDFIVHKWLDGDPTKPIEWHRIEANALVGTPRCDPRILWSYLDFDPVERQKPYWQVWSHKHPELAKVFWPLVSEAAQRKQYYLLPEFFEKAKSSKDSSALEKQLLQILEHEAEIAKNLP
jgi:hypothetical protein